MQLRGRRWKSVAMFNQEETDYAQLFLKKQQQQKDLFIVYDWFRLQYSVTQIQITVLFANLSQSIQLLQLLR